MTKIIPYIAVTVRQITTGSEWYVFHTILNQMMDLILKKM